MNSRRKLGGESSVVEEEIEMKAQQKNRTSKWREMFRRRRRMHDPMLVLNIAMFNFADGWNRTFSPLKAHENGR